MVDALILLWVVEINLNFVYIQSSIVSSLKLSYSSWLGSRIRNRSCLCLLNSWWSFFRRGCCCWSSSLILTWLWQIMFKNFNSKPSYQLVMKPKRKEDYQHQATNDIYDLCFKIGFFTCASLFLISLSHIFATSINIKWFPFIYLFWFTTTLLRWT